MDKIQREIMELNYKVDRLSQIVEQISKENSFSRHQIQGQIKQTQPLNSNLQNIASIDEMMSNLSKNRLENSFHGDISLMVHKDILNDEKENNSQNYDYSQTQEEYGMSCELQVQRLTAQLTAAYHRIAALEEQLLAKRNKS